MEPRPATISLVLRVLADPARHGSLVGQAEVVATGEVVAVHGTDELLALLARLAPAAPAPLRDGHP